MMSYINETDFVIENKKLVYPEIVADGLQLYYDSKGKRDTDYHRDTMLDMSGNKNHGNLYNFAYEKNSGYKDGLVFDYIDDKLVRPALNLKPDDFTFMLNGNIISFSPDGTVKRVQDGEVIESKGFNLIKNGDFILSSHPEWRQTNSLEYNINKNEITIIGKGSPMGTGGNWFALNTISPPNSNSIFYITALSKGQGQAYIGVSYNATNLYLNDSFRRVSYLGEFITNNNVNGLAVLGGTLGATVTFKEVMAINLTETFGAGNEPTKEEMDEIINRFGFIPNSQDLIDRIEYKGNDLGDMENIIDGLYKTEVLSGEEVYTDKADDAVVHVDVDGKSYQHAGSGKNLLSVKTYKGRIDHSTGNEREDSYRIIGGFIKVNPNTKYTLSREYEVSNTDLGYYLYNENKEYIGGIYGYKDYNSLTFLTSEGAEYVKVSYSINDTFVQLEEGSTATAYEPPAPTPDYPIAIHSLNDFDIVSSVGKRNILSGAKNERTSANEYIGIPITSQAERYLGKKIKISFELKLSASGAFSVYSLGGYNIGLKTTYQGTTEFKKYEFSGAFTKVITTENWCNLSFYATYGTGRIPTVKNVKIEIDEDNKGVTPYTPSLTEVSYDTNQEGIYKTNILLDEPLRSVGGVKDRLFRDNDGVWKVERNVGEHIEDGSANWIKKFGVRFDTTSNPLSNSSSSDYNYLVSSTHYTYYMGTTAKVNGTWSTGDQLRIVPPNDSVTEVDIKDFMKKEYDNGNPVIWLYPRKTTIEILDQELQDKLNNLRSFEDSNYVYTVIPNEDNYISDNLKPTLHAKFLYNNWYKEDRVINNLMIYNRALTNEEMLQNYKTIKRRWGM